MQAGLQTLAVTTRKHANRTVADSVISGGECHKDMGGLLEENHRDYLFFYAGGADVEVLKGNMLMQQPVKVTRKVNGTSSQRHVYSGLYEVVDSWPVLDKRQSAAGLHQAGLFCESEATENHVYFKLLRLPGQPPLTSVQMAFTSDVPDTTLPADRSVPSAERSFKSTRWYYEHFHPTGISVPVAKFRHAKPKGFRRGIFQADFCDRCGIDGDDVEMHYCKSCHEQGIDTVTHMECVNKHELLWLEGNPDGRHWRCRQCRQRRWRPKDGKVYDDFAGHTAASTEACIGTAVPVVQSLSVPQQPSGVTFTSRSKRPRQQAAGLTEDKQQGPASCGDSNNNGTQVLKLEAIAMPQRLSRVSAAAVAAETNVSGAATAPQQPSGVTFTSRSKRSRPQAAVLTESEQQGPAEPRGDSNSKDGTQILKLKAIPWPQHFSRVPAAAVAAETNVSGAATDKTQATLSAQPCQTHSKPPNAAVLTHSRIAAQQAMVVPVARMACQAAVMPQVTAVSSLTASIAPSVKAAVCGPSAYARPVATSAVSSHPVCSLSEALRVVNAKLAGKDAILPEQLQAYVDIHDSLGLDEADLKKNLMDVGKLTLNQALYMKVCVMEAKRNVT